jgi:hypothetical protein
MQMMARHRHDDDRLRRTAVMGRMGLAAALGFVMVIGLGSTAHAQSPCAPAYQDFCAKLGWEDPLDNVCRIFGHGGFTIIAPFVPQNPCGPTVTVQMP